MKKFMIIMILLVTTLIGCSDENNTYLDVFYEKELYLNESMIIEISTNDQFEVINHTQELIEITLLEKNKIKVLAISEGKAQLSIKTKKNISKEIAIDILQDKAEVPIIPTSINLKIIEEGPYYVGHPYHLEYTLTPMAASDNVYFHYNHNNVVFNEESLEITFTKAGLNSVTCYSYDNFEIGSTIKLDVKYDPDIEQYYLMFIGNSLTIHDYNIPKIIKKMIEEDGIYVEVTTLTEGGGWILDQQHSCANLLAKNRYTHVILQEQSAGPINNYDKFKEAVMYLAPRIKENEARLMLYQTWTYDTDNWNGLNRDTMTKELIKAYDKMADLSGAFVNRVGEAFYIYMNKYINNPSLYKDINHPSIYGAYLSACVHYASITGRKASLNTFTEIDIDASIMADIQKVADEVVFG